MVDLLAALGEDPAVAVVVRVGREHFRAGEIGVAVGGDGHVVVSQRRAGDGRNWRGRLEAPRVRALGRELSALGLADGAAEPKRIEPDDAPVVLEVRRDGTTVRSMRSWWSERHRDPRVDGLLRRWESLAAEFTDGRLPWGGGPA